MTDELDYAIAEDLREHKQLERDFDNLGKTWVGRHFNLLFAIMVTIAVFLLGVFGGP